MSQSSETKKKKSFKIALIKQMIALSTSGFGLVAALAWNSVIQEFVNNYIKQYLAVGSGLISLLIYAIAITILAVFVTYQFSRLLEHIQEE